jgi:hypothetical protein
MSQNRNLVSVFFLLTKIKKEKEERERLENRYPV